MPNYENYDNEEEAKTLALDEYDKGKVNQKMWLRACLDHDVSNGNTTKILYVEYRALQRKAVFLANLLREEQRESKLIAQDVWEMYDKQTYSSKLIRVDATARNIYWTEFFLEQLFNERELSSSQDETGLFQRKHTLSLYFGRALTYVKRKPTHFINMGLLSVILFLAIDTHQIAGQASTYAQTAQRYSYEAADYSKDARDVARDARDVARKARTEAASAAMYAKNAFLLCD